MSQLARAGIAVDVPSGWDGAITGGGFPLLADGSKQPTIVHLASFPMPAERDSFGAFTVGLMQSHDTFMVLFEYGPESANTPLFQSVGIPRNLEAGDFDRNALQRGIQGQSGLQRFFTDKDRAFCLYVVLGSHIDRADLIPMVNDVLATVQIS
jgi:hypothetical protein